MICCLNEIFVVLISILIFLFLFLFCSILERKDDKSYKRDIIVLISFPIPFVSTSFQVNIGKEMSLPGFRNCMAAKAKIYGVLYNQASSIAFDETSSYWSALKSS